MDQRPATISNAFKRCLSRLEALVLKLKTNTTASLPGLDPTSWEDELGRLKVWGGNLAAHQTGQASLEYRLRDASHIQQNIVELLNALDLAICDVEEVLTEPPVSEPDYLPKPFDLSSVAENEFQQLYHEVVGIIKDLFQMALLIRKPAQHSRLTEDQPIDISVFEPYDLKHVRDKFPLAHETLVHRLGVALTRRRKHLKYWERHHAKLSRGLAQTTRPKDSSSDNATEFSDTVATALGAEIPIVSGDSSHSVISEGSFASTFVQSEDIRIPNPPKDSLDGTPFECPFCRYIIVVKDTRAWIKHFLLDLKPYSCTALDCNVPHRIYATQHEWSHHLRSDHCVSWLEKGSNSQEDTAVCPLCKSEITLGKSSESHLARHLQELALFVVPRQDEEWDDRVIDEEGKNMYSEDGSLSTELLDNNNETKDNIIGFIEESHKEVKAEGQEGIQHLATMDQEYKVTVPGPPPPPPVYWMCWRCKASNVQNILNVPHCVTPGCQGEASDLKSIKLDENREPVRLSASGFVFAEPMGGTNLAGKGEEASNDDKKNPIKFKDVLGRRYSFPFRLCNTWPVSLKRDQVLSNHKN